MTARKTDEQKAAAKAQRAAAKGTGSDVKNGNDVAPSVPAGIGLVVTEPAVVTEPTATVAARPKAVGPVCPNCSVKDQEPVLTVSQGTKQLFTWFVCPHNCGFRLKVPRPDLQQHLERHQKQEPAVRRP